MSTMHRLQRWTAPGLLAAALVCLLVGAQPWWQLRLASGVTTMKDSQGLPVSLAAATAAAALLALTVGGWGRRVLGVSAAVLGLLMAVVGVRPPRPSASQVEQAVLHAGGGGVPTPEQSWLSTLFAAIGLLVCCLGVLLAVAPGATRRRRRFERGSVAPHTVDLEDSTEVWKALDAGIDPTSEANPTARQNPPNAGRPAPDRSK